MGWLINKMHHVTLRPLYHKSIESVPGPHHLEICLLKQQHRSPKGPELLQIINNQIKHTVRNLLQFIIPSKETMKTRGKEIRRLKRSTGLVSQMNKPPSHPWCECEQQWRTGCCWDKAFHSQISVSNARQVAEHSAHLMGLVWIKQSR